MFWTGKNIGAILLVAGTAVGGGMLALPLVSSQLGILEVVSLLIGMWLYMTLVSLLTLEINLRFNKKGTAIPVIAEHVLGKWGKWIALISLITLLYSLLVAYISGGVSSIVQLINIVPQKYNVTQYLPIIFTITFGGLVYFSVKAVDVVNRVFLIAKIFVFLLMIAMLASIVNVEYLQSHGGNNVAMMVAIPIFFTSFGFHGSIPVIINYVGVSKPNDLGKIFFYGGFLSLLFYIFWVFMTLGSVHNSDFQQFTGLGSFISKLGDVSGGKYISYCTKAFTVFAIVTSFLGVALGLKESLIDLLSNCKRSFSRQEIWGMTFVMPMVMAMFFPDSFVGALKIAAVFLSVFAVIIPSLILLVMRKNGQQGKYVAPIGNISIYLCLAVGISIIALVLINFIN